MALFSGFSEMDAKTRVLIVFGGIIGVAVIAFFGVRYLSGKKATNASSVAAAPGGLQSVPGSQLTAEYYRTLEQSNAQRSKQAQMTGGSAVPTLMNVPATPSAEAGFEQPPPIETPNCGVVCPNPESPDVSNEINDLVKAGTLPQKDADLLLRMAKANVPVSEYEDELNELVKEGKLTPEQARKLLEQYKKQHANALLRESGAAMDALIKTGQLPLDVANSLLTLQKSGVTPAEYAAELQRLVKEGKISPATAEALLGQYRQQQLAEASKSTDYALAQAARAGAITPDVQKLLSDLQNKNVPVDQYAAELQRLVAEGKLTPAEAAKLLADYKAKRARLGATDALTSVEAKEAALAAAQITDMVGANAIPPDVTKQLQDLEDKDVSPEDYKAALDALVKEGKITPAQAAALLASYNKLHAARTDATNLLGQMLTKDVPPISRDTANAIQTLNHQNLTPDEYAAALDKLVKEGKLTPAQAARLLAQYKQLYAAKQDADHKLHPSGSAISQETADKLLALQNKDVSPEEYQAALDELVKAGKLTPEQAAALMAGYNKLHAARAEMKTLAQMQSNNASPTDYANELKRAVQAGVLTPEEATDLMQEYQNMVTAPTTPLAATAALPGGSDFARLAQQVQAAQARNAAGAGPVNAAQFAAAAAAPAQAQAAASNAQAEAEAAAAAAQAHQQRIQQIMAGMSSQAQSLLSAWQPPHMSHVGGYGGAERSEKGEKGGGGPGARAGGGKQSAEAASAQSTGAPLVKTGTIYYAVLDTAVDSDYPDTPVMATIVQGPLKGCKLLGKLTLVSGKDKVSLNFTLMDKEDWPKTKSINAFAIDPETARTVMASHVDYHYLQRYGGIMATSFLTGYSSSITQAGTSNTGIFGTSSTHPSLSPLSRIAVGLGQIGTTLNASMQNQLTLPNTVKVDSGVALGILFMSDVTA